MKDLTNLLGFDVKMISKSELEFGDGIDKTKPDKRFLDDLKGLTYDRKLKLIHSPIYYMYRDRHEKKDEAAIRKYKVRYDITLIPPRMIGEEFIKTSGHFHPEKKGTGIAYPEVYEVISGQATYLLIGSVLPYDKVTEAYLCTVEAGEKAIMPSGYGHVTINLIDEPLLMTNWVAEEFSSDYGPIIEYHGASHFLIKDSPYKIVENTKWGELPEIKIVKPKSLPKFALEFGKPMYQQALNNMEKLDYLVNPEKYLEEIKPSKVFAY